MTNSFESIPEDREPSYPCPECETGNVTRVRGYSKEWSCDNCNFAAGPDEEKSSAECSCYESEYGHQPGCYFYGRGGE